MYRNKTSRLKKKAWEYMTVSCGTVALIITVAPWPVF